MEDYTFDSSSVDRISAVVRTVESASPLQLARFKQSHVNPNSNVAVMIIPGANHPRGWLPGVIVYLRQPTTTTTTTTPSGTTTSTTTPTTTTTTTVCYDPASSTTTTTTTSTTPSGTTTTTSTTAGPLLPEDSFYQQLTDQNERCWLILKSPERESAVPGDIWSAKVLNFDGKKPICLVSDHIDLSNIPGVGVSPPPQPCGDCFWDYDFVNNKWVLASVCCRDGCNCTAPQFCPPISDPPLPCTRVRTPCASIASHQVAKNCGSTTTTTTTLVATCTGCTWFFIPGEGWLIKEDNCRDCYGCEPPTSTPSVCVPEATTPCNPPPPPPPGCGGSCSWVYVGNTFPNLQTINGYYLPQGGNNCSSFIEPCTCLPPSEPPVTTACGTVVQTPCFCPENCSGTVVTTTTGPCGSDCVWNTSDGLTWRVHLNFCKSGCGCPYPIQRPTNVCDITRTKCMPDFTTTTSTTPLPTTTTTTTTTPTTTTTTTTTPSEYCCYEITSVTGGLCPPVGTRICDACGAISFSCGGGGQVMFVTQISGPYTGPSAGTDCSTACGQITEVTSTTVPDPGGPE